MDPYNKNMRTYAADSGILNGVESFLKGLPDSMRKTVTAGEIADVVLSMIRDLRENTRKELEAELGTRRPSTSPSPSMRSRPPLPSSSRHSAR